MPPHCDTMDGPVVRAAKEALEKGDVRIILPWASKDAEAEIKEAFKKTLAVGKLGGNAKELGDLWFFETVVRLHRTGEGEPYTGLKPAGLDEGPVVPRAERAIQQGNVKELITFLQRTVEEEVIKKFNHILTLKNYKDVDSAREYIEAMLGLTIYAHELYSFIREEPTHKKH